MASERVFLSESKNKPIDKPLQNSPGCCKLNYYRLEAGRFEDFVSYGLKSFAHDGVT